MFLKYKKTKPKISSAIIVSCIAIFLILGWVKLVDFYKSQLLLSTRDNISSELFHYANSFTSSINRRIALIEGLYAFVVMDTSQHRLKNEFEPFVSRFYKSMPGIRNFAALFSFTKTK